MLADKYNLKTHTYHICSNILLNCHSSMCSNSIIGSQRTLFSPRPVQVLDATPYLLTSVTLGFWLVNFKFHVFSLAEVKGHTAKASRVMILPLFVKLFHNKMILPVFKYSHCDAGLSFSGIISVCRYIAIWKNLIRLT